MLSKRIVLAFVLLVCSLCAGSASASAATGADFLKRTVAIGGEQRGYRVYLPENFDRKKKYPVVLYLHGSYHWGEDNEGQLKHGLPAMMVADGKIEARALSAFIGVFPQSRPQTPWVGEMAEYAVKALDQTVAEFKADSRRLYATGFSLGGYGSWYVAAKYPRKFAAIVPIGGNIRIPSTFPRERIERFVPADMLALYDAADPHAAFVRAAGKMPVWIFHGEEDKQIPVAEARGAAEAARAAGFSVKYTEYKGAGHFVFEQAYSDPGFWTWLLSQRLGK